MTHSEKGGIKYVIKKSWHGQKTINYDCPHCGVNLTSKFDEAGTKQQCPSCSKPLVVPGEVERQREEQEAAVWAKVEQEQRAQQARFELDKRQANVKAQALKQQQKAQQLEYERTNWSAAGGKAPTGPFIICPNPQCGYQGPSARKAKGSGCLLVFLLLLWILPGIIYLIFASGHRLMCPRCGVFIRDE